MKKIFRKVQFVSNIAVIVIAILLSVIVVKQYILSNTSAESTTTIRKIPATYADVPTEGKPPAPQTTPVGQNVPLQNIDWKKNNQTLVLYLSTKCRFCTESGPFYQRLLQESAGKNVRFITVVPQTVDEGREYLNSLGVKIDDVYQNPLQSIGVRSTPTLLLVNESGVVTDYWVGKLKEDKESQVLAKLKG